MSQLEYLWSAGLRLLPYGNFLDCSKLKVFVDNKSSVAEKLKFVLGRVQHIVGKGHNAGYPAMFSKGFYFRVVKSGLCGKELKD